MEKAKELLNGEEEGEVAAATHKLQTEETNGISEESDLKEEEINEAMKKMKLKKAAGIDEILMEAWLFGGLIVKEELVNVIKKVWGSGKCPEDWKTNLVVPLYKKGDQEKVENYRGIFLLCTAYKIYAEVVKGRLEEEVERRKLIPESQGGFRKGKSTVDNIFILNHIVQREKRKADSKVCYVR